MCAQPLQQGQDPVVGWVLLPTARVSAQLPQLPDAAGVRGRSAASGLLCAARPVFSLILATP
jgi:hypothetical protein